jgi:hypothetical protein
MTVNEIIDSAYAASIQQAFGVLVENLATSSSDPEGKFRNAVDNAKRAKEIANQVLGGTLARAETRAKRKAKS